MRKRRHSGFSFSGAVASAAVSLSVTCASFGGPVIARQPAGLDYAGVYELHDMQPALTGKGIRVAMVGRSMTYSDGLPMNDYRPLATHEVLAGSTPAFHDRQDVPAGISAHETAVASILFGNDPNVTFTGLGSFRYEGACPDASVDMYEFWYFLTANVFAQTRPQADVVTISLGSQFEDWWTRGIDAMADRYGLPIVAGIGNGLSAHDSALFPAAGSNVIAVGVVDQVQSDNVATGLSRFWLPQAASSSCGPTDDNRAKPDIVAPGRFIVADTAGTTTLVVTPSCSSYATPVVAGTVCLLAQAAKADPNLSDAVRQGSAMVMRAILMTSAHKLPWWHKGMAGAEDDHVVPLDYSQGAGAVDAAGACRLLRAGEHKAGSTSMAGWDTASLKLDSTDGSSYLLNEVTIVGKTVTATLVWNRHYSRTYPFAHDTAGDTDLTLELWAYDAAGARLADYSDSHADNVEHIAFVAEPNSRYFLLVRQSDIAVPRAASESYAIAWQVTDTPARDAAWYDLNGDGKVNTADAVVLLSGFTRSEEAAESSTPFGDFNGDGRVDVLDLLTLTKFLAHP
jgi:hypothetical protein